MPSSDCANAASVRLIPRQPRHSCASISTVHIPFHHNIPPSVDNPTITMLRTTNWLLPLLLALMVLVEVSRCEDVAATGADAAAAADSSGVNKFAAQASEAIDNTLVSFKNGINSLLEDGSKFGSFLANVTTHFKKLTGQDKETVS